MVTTGTYNFAPSAGDIVLNAFGMIQVRRWELTDQHLADANYCCQMQMVEFSNQNPNTWQRETVPIMLASTVGEYSLPPQTLAIAIAYIVPASSIGDRTLGPISMNDWASLPNKYQAGIPTSYMFKLLTPVPTVTTWPVINVDNEWTLVCETFRQSQDVQLSGGLTIDAPYRFLDAFTKGVAHRLAGYYPPKDPQAIDRLEKAKDMAFNLAAQRDQESTPMYVRPDMSGYFS